MKTILADEMTTLIQSDSFYYLKKLASESMDLIVTDPPYFLSNDGISNHSGHMVSVNKGNWDQLQAEQVEHFYQKLIQEFQRILKPDGTVWIFGTMHNIYLIGYLLKQYNFKILNNITWQKTNPVPNLSCRMFTHSTETILWAKKSTGKQYFNYDLMKQENGGKQMKDVWTTSTVSKSEKRFGKHPTQKPLAVLLRILQASAKSDDLILDPFVGSGTTAVAGRILGLKTIGVDNSSEYLEIAKQRILDYQNERIGKIK